MTADSLLTGSSVLIPFEEYNELIDLRKENKELKKKLDKLDRENYGLKTTVRNLRATIEKQYGYHTYAN